MNACRRISVARPLSALLLGGCAAAVSIAVLAQDRSDAVGELTVVTGGESDVAYENGKRDFDEMPASVPTFYGVYPSVGHGGTYNQDNGGAYSVAAVAWLKWQLIGDTSAAGRGYFVGENCGICLESNWETDSRSLC